MDIVYHSILLFLMEENVSVQPDNKHRLKAMQVESTPEGRPEFSLKIVYSYNSHE